MKTLSFGKLGLAMVAAVLPITGCAPKTAQSAPATLTETQIVATAAAVPVSASNVAEANPPAVQTGVEAAFGTNEARTLGIPLEDAPAQLVSAPATPAHTRLSTPATELVRLAQAGVEEGVMLAFVTNSPYYFALTSEDVIYLGDIGVPDSVVTAMLQQDQTVRSSGFLTDAAPPVYTNTAAEPTGAPVPYETTEPLVQTAIPESSVQYVQEPANVSYTYFYSSLAPYGSWVDVSGYGLCWRPTAAIVNPLWQPYANNGRWIYSDCGWYWYSNYSWGWAPFHYGRWFQHNSWGWCWAPDTVWGPSWVSWRYSPGYCGWAPLPPSACYTAGFGFTYYGRSVAVGFNFGLKPHHYTFVPSHRFYDRHPHQHRLDRDHVGRVFDRTVVANRFEHDRNNRVINRGIPVDRVAQETGQRIDMVRIRESERPTRPRMEIGSRGEGRTLTVYQPDLPQPDRPARMVGSGVRPATREGTGGTEAGSELTFAPNRELSFDTRPEGRDAGRATTRAARPSAVDPAAAESISSRATRPSDRVQGRPTPPVSRSDSRAGEVAAGVPEMARPATPPGQRNIRERQPEAASRTEPVGRVSSGRELSRTPSAPNPEVSRLERSTPDVARQELTPRIQQRPPLQRALPDVQAATPMARQDQRITRQEPVRLQSPASQQPSALIQRQQVPQLQRSTPTIPQARPMQPQQPIMRMQPSPQIVRQAPSAPVQRSMPRIESAPAPSAPVIRQAPSSGGMGGAGRSAPQGVRSPGR